MNNVKDWVQCSAHKETGDSIGICHHGFKPVMACRTGDCSEGIFNPTPYCLRDEIPDEMVISVQNARYINRP